MIHKLITLPSALLYALCMLVACSTPSYPSGIDRPATITELDREVIAYIDKRLEEEYYWLDEVQQRGGSFNRNQTWDRYLSSALNMLTTNGDDGYINNQGKRVLYSYIRNIGDESRASAHTSGFGIDLHFTIVTVGEGLYGFVVNNIYDDSPAARAAVSRGDIIVEINGQNITQNNYQTLFNSIYLNTASSLDLVLFRQNAPSEQERSYTAKLQRDSYSANPISYCAILDIEGISARRHSLDSVQRKAEAQRKKLQSDVTSAKKTMSQLSKREQVALKEKMESEERLDAAIDALRKLTKGNKEGASFSRSTSNLNLPVVGGRVREYKGNMAEIVGTKGADVRSIYDGKVVEVRRNRITGKYDVFVAHGEYITSYANLDNVVVRKEQKIAKNGVLGEVGASVNLTTMKTEYKMVFGIYSPNPKEVMRAANCFKKK